MSKGNVTKVTPKKKEDFLFKLAETGKITVAADSVGLSRMTLYREREKDSEFRAQWAEAEKIGHEVLAGDYEAEADRRAIEGWEEPRFHEGIQCGTVRKFSDTLLILRLKALKPDVYKDKVDVQHSTDPNRPPKILVEYVQPATDNKNSAP